MEPRWPLALVLGGFIAITIVLNILVPDRARFGPRGVVPAIEVGLLLALLAADPTAIARRTRWLRPLAITLISTLLVVVVAADAKLITDIIRGAKVTQSAAGLLASGAILWLGTAVSFGLFYWELDAGGPLARFRGTHPYPDFAFSQQLSPDMTFTATGKTMTGVSDPMIATLAIEVIRTDVKYSATLRPKHTPPNHERLITSHVSRRCNTSSAAVSNAPPIQSR